MALPCEAAMEEQAKRLLTRLQGRTLATAESLTGGLIGSILTAVPGASRVYRGGVISYTNEIKHRLLNVSQALLEYHGAVSAPVAESMARGAREALAADLAVSVTGLAGPDGDEFGNPVGTVFIGYADQRRSFVRQFLFQGSRDEIRHQTAQAALALLLEYV